MGSTWKQKWARWMPKGLQKLRLIGTGDPWGGTVGNKFFMMGIHNGGC